jgi:hypothetical protein
MKPRRLPPGTRIAVLVAFAVLSLTPTVFAMYQRFGKGDPNHPVGGAGWPAELARLANRGDRVDGHWINGSWTFHFDGDAARLNDFLKQYAGLKDLRRTLVIVAPPKTTNGAPTSPPHDWQLSVVGDTEPGATVALFLGRGVQLADVVVPAGVEVMAEGKPTPEMIDFFAAHRAKDRPVPGTAPVTRPVHN